jgi:uncharacterized protein (TIGR00730 family)
MLLIRFKNLLYFNESECMSQSQPVIRSICVYCGSADSIHQDYLNAAFAMGEVIAKAGLRLVYGAGKTGLMGAIAEGVLQSGGQVTGVVPTYLNFSHLIHNQLSQLEVVQNMHERKARMSELADAFVALPGGFGTFEELFETLTWAQLGLHEKPVGILNTRHYFDPLLTLVQHSLSEGFIYSEHRTLLLSAEEPAQLLNLLSEFQVPNNLNRWINRNQ